MVGGYQLEATRQKIYQDMVVLITCVSSRWGMANHSRLRRDATQIPQIVRHIIIKTTKKYLVCNHAEL